MANEQKSKEPYQPDQDRENQERQGGQQDFRETGNQPKRESTSGGPRDVAGDRGSGQGSPQQKQGGSDQAGESGAERSVDNDKPQPGQGQQRGAAND